MKVFFSYRILFLTGSFLYLTFPQRSFAEFIHHSDVVRDVKKKFAKISTYKARFVIRVIDAQKTRVSSGSVYYKKTGKVNFSFDQPRGDKIISNGKKMWVYVQKLNAVGVQSLDEGDNSVYNSASYPGLIRLFSRYHYRFDKTEQPREVLGGRHYVLSLSEKVDSGGFHHIKLYIDAKKKIIKKMFAASRSGRKVEVEFKRIRLNVELPGGLFSYKVEGNVKVVENPLTVN